MKDPLISVIIPAYNAERWIRDTIRSVLDQTLSDLEVIVVNDGSIDGTSVSARSIKDDRVRVIDQKNTGVSGARNAGYHAARGTFIAFLDADDAMLPENLGTKLDALEQANVDWVFGDLALCDADMKPIGKVMRGTDRDVVRTILRGIDPAVPAPCSNVLAHRKCFADGIRLDEDLSNAADQDLALQLATHHSYCHVPKALSLYRVLPGSMSHNIALYEKDHLHLMRKADSLGLFRDRSFRRQCYANAYWSIAGSWWINAGRPLKAIPFLFRAILLRPSLLLRPLRRTRG